MKIRLSPVSDECQLKGTGNVRLFDFDHDFSSSCISLVRFVVLGLGALSWTANLLSPQFDDGAGSPDDSHGRRCTAPALHSTAGELNLV
jgi:hypothetical protein